MSTTVTTTTGAAAAGHTRRNNGVLAEAERRLLIWMAERLPRWIHSDHLSAVGVLGMAGVGAAFAAGGSDPRAYAAGLQEALVEARFGVAEMRRVLVAVEAELQSERKQLVDAERL